MTLPRVLVVDDQYARDPAEREVFLRHSGLREANQQSFLPETEIVGTAVFCSGQRSSRESVANDYAVVRKAVEEGDPSQPWSLVLLDARFESGRVGEDGEPGGSRGDDSFGEELRDRLAEDFPNLPVVMLTSKEHRDLQDHEAPYLSKQGLKPLDVAAALLSLGSLTSEQSCRLLNLPPGIVAVAPATLEAFRSAFLYAPAETSVLLLGESGVGKEVVARYIHQCSSRRTGPFIALNVAAVPHDLLESELFGHEKGAFTGALRAREGLFQRAEGGTLFLDEIGDMSLAAQAKVLRAIQEREVRKVGGESVDAVDIRLLSATSRDLRAMIAAGQFREDLFYRIGVAPLSIPPLRERVEDIPALASRLLAKFSERAGKTGIALTVDAIARLQAHSFPGNVRELENLLQRLLAGAGNNSLVGKSRVERVLGDSLAASSPKDAISASIPEKTIESNSRAEVNLASLPAIIDSVSVETQDPALAGAMPRLEMALARLLRRLAGAALERSRHPISNELNRQRAMQMLTGDQKLKAKAPARVLNRLIGRNQDAELTDNDLEKLVRAWREGSDLDP